MAQNYKVFIEGNCLCFDSVFDRNLNSIETAHFESLTKLKSVENIYSLSKNCNIISPYPKREFKEFKKHFDFIRAAGGIVEYEQKFLFIKRLGKWDLPKGKIEKQEHPKNAAIREIREECNLEGHEIVKKIGKTYHTYALGDRQLLKKTFWYLMRVEDLSLDKLKPQLEEGITEIRWFSIEEFSTVRENTFDAIHEVLDLFLKNYHGE